VSVATNTGLGYIAPTPFHLQAGSSCSA